MVAIVPHPTSNNDTLVGNNGFFPDISVTDLRQQYNINDRTEAAELIRIVESNLMRINDDLNKWVCQQQRKGYQALSEVPADTLGERSVHEICYLQAVSYGVKADVIRAKLDYDLSQKGDQEADEREDKAMHYSAESSRALRKLLGRGHIRVRRITTKKNNNSPLDNLTRNGHDNGE